jgi:hypothetical protein
LELSSASVAGTLRTAGGEHEVLAFAHRERNVVCLRVTSLPENARLSLKPLAEMNDSLDPFPCTYQSDTVNFLYRYPRPSGT